MAPFTPFVAEEVFKNLTKEESVHLADFPKYDKKLIDDELNSEMQMVRKFVKLGLAARAKAGIKVRQPLSELFINEIVSEKLVDLIKDEVNVREVKFVGSVEQMPGIYTEEEGNSMIGLNIVISEELHLEGEARELIRQIQELRKRAGFEVDNRISICYEGGKNLFDKFGDLIMRETLATGIWECEDPNADISEMLDLETQPVKVWLKRV
jgi:isoleucyl-tRNA synthetase